METPHLSIYELTVSFSASSSGKVAEASLNTEYLVGDATNGGLMIKNMADR